MDSDRQAYLLFLLIALMFPVMALMARRLPTNTVFRLALIWLVIFAGGAVLVKLLFPLLSLKFT